MTFLAMSLGQVASVFNARTDAGSGFHGASANRWLWAAIGITGALEVAALTLPGLSDLLGLVPLPADAWVVSIGLGLVPLAAIQTARALR